MVVIMSNWQDILKTQETIADTKVGIFKPKQGFNLDNNNEKCCEDARLKIIEEEKREHLSWSYSGDGPSKKQLLGLYVVIYCSKQLWGSA